MSKKKLERFAAMREFPNVVQFMLADLYKAPLSLRGQWRAQHFKNTQPIVLELGCGKGEYTVGLARRFPNQNFIGLDIKGSRMFIGARQAIRENLTNAAFMRTRIDFVNALFGKHEVDEIWITFPDPQLEKPRKRLTSPSFLKRYVRLLKPGGIIHLKTDSIDLHDYTRKMLIAEGHETLVCSNDIYNELKDNEVLMNIQTGYETRFLGEGKKITYIAFRMKPNAYEGAKDFVDAYLPQE
ncbi:MAG: tRNA (guanosine(46)-N7)-methyltransferase TrmB [Bacteroidia bacterium]